jgi:predicted component of type VI protein secretion system
MGTKPSRKTDNLIAEIRKKPGAYSTDLAIALATYASGSVVAPDAKVDKLRIKSARSQPLSSGRLTNFRILERDTEKAFVVETEAFNFGGPQAPFPQELYDEILKEHRFSSKAALDFLDIFVDRFAKLDFALREKLSKGLSHFKLREKSFAPELNGFLTIKEPFLPIRDAEIQKKFSRLQGTAFRPPVSAFTLKKIFDHLFGRPVNICQNEISFLNIPKNSQLHLTQKPNTSKILGKNTFLGRRKAVADGQIKIIIHDFPDSIFSKLISDNCFVENLRRVFRSIYHKPLRVIMEIETLSVAGPKLSSNSDAKTLMLGLNSHLYSKLEKYEPVVLKFDSWSTV